MPTLLNLLPKFLKLTGPVINPKSNYLYETPDGIQLGARKILSTNVDGSTSTETASGVRGAEVRKRQTLCAMAPVLPTTVAAAFTGTYSSMDTAPGDFDAVALILENIDSSSVIIDKIAIAVSERSDTSKTVPIINGTNYNVSAAAGTQNGFLPVTVSGSASATVPAGTANTPGLLVTDFTPLGSIPRVDDSNKFPLTIVRIEVSARALSVMAFPSAAEVDNYNAALAPYEHYQVAQAAVSGVTTPSTFTTTWAAGASTQTMRVFGYLYRLRGTGRTIFYPGDSLMAGSGAGGDIVTKNAGNLVGGWAPKAALALANKKDPVGFVQLGVAGNTSAQYIARAKAFLNVFKPTSVVFPFYSPNDDPTTAYAVQTTLSASLDFADYLFSLGVKPIAVNPWPFGSPSTNTIRMDLITKMAALRNIDVLDVNSVAYDSTQTGQGFWKSNYYLDSTHGNPAANTAGAVAVIPNLRLWA